MSVLRTCGLLLLTSSVLLGGNRPGPGAAGLTIKEIMDSMIDPSARAVWDSVASYIQANHIEEKAPQNDMDWEELRRNANTLLHAANLLLVPGTRVANPDDKSDNPRIELHPEQIEMLISGDKAAWTRRAYALRESSGLVLKATDNRDVRALQASGNAINTACEQCHQKYWYPNRNKRVPEP
jgi:hypothetical protein